jgi:hypothetical protein
MDNQHNPQPNTAIKQLPQSWYFYFYFSPPTWSAGTRGVVESMTT